MAIYSNNGGVISEHSAEFCNEGGVIVEQSEVWCNDGGVKYQIFGAKPELSWVYENSTTESPAVSDKGYKVSNTKTAVRYKGVKSSVFSLTKAMSFSGTITVDDHLTATSWTASFVVYSEDGTAVLASDSTTTSVTKTGTLPAGKYYIVAGASGANVPSGAAATAMKYTFTFDLK